MIGLFVGPFVVQSPNTNDICDESVSRTSQAFLDWQEGIYQQLLYYQLVQALLATILMPLTFCKGIYLCYSYVCVIWRVGDRFCN